MDGGTSSWVWMLDDEDQEFHKYWFMLEDNQLKYYETKDGEINGEIDLTGCSPEIVQESKYNRESTFELTAPAHENMFVLSVSNSATLQEWTLSLRRAMLRLRREQAKRKTQQARQAQRAQEAKAAEDVDAPKPELRSFGSQDVTLAEPPPSLGAEDSNDVYRKWLDEVKQDSSASESRVGLLGNNAPKRNCAPACCHHCTIA